MQSAPPRRRSVIVTLLAWVVIVLSGLFIPISFISLLMIFVAKDGTSTFDPVGFFIVVLAPPLALIAGIGLLLRRAWGLYCVIALLGFIIVVQGWTMMTLQIGTKTYTSPSGVETTVTTSGPNLSLPIMALSGLVIIWLLRPSVRAEFASSRKVNVPPIPQMSVPQGVAPPVAAPQPPRVVAAPTSPAKQRMALVGFLAFLLGISIVMGWLVTSGISSGETYFPAKRSSQQRSVVREQEPATFWMSIGVYSAIGLGSAGVGLWMLYIATRGGNNRALSERPY